MTAAFQRFAMSTEPSPPHASCHRIRRRAHGWTLVRLPARDEVRRESRFRLAPDHGADSGEEQGRADGGTRGHEHGSTRAAVVSEEHAVDDEPSRCAGGEPYE